MLMSLKRNGGQPLVTVTVCEQRESLKSPERLVEMLTYYCVLLFLNCLEQHSADKSLPGASGRKTYKSIKFV